MFTTLLKRHCHLFGLNSSDYSLSPRKMSMTDHTVSTKKVKLVRMAMAPIALALCLPVSGLFLLLYAQIWDEPAEIYSRNPNRLNRNNEYLPVSPMTIPSMMTRTMKKYPV